MERKKLWDEFLKTGKIEDYLKFKEKKNTYRQHKAARTHIYKKCPNCHAVLRLPRRKGKHTTVCPNCSKEFKVRVFKA